MALSGGHNNTLDEKGRVAFPARLKAELSCNNLVITRGIEKCLYLFSPDSWREFESKLQNPEVMSRDWRKMQRHFLGWASEAEIDKSGRIAIPQSLREYAGLERDLIVMGLGRRIEIWDAVYYRQSQGEEEGLDEIAERYGIGF
ncbi:MAG: division/cell wall cluster transcriptional repressor MraZ [Spirochaetaceae bacterium]|jgi:MraZ protein|nr:division/cell wall cluster transcriptional repressor MraZ [Spirochaetaceae bacterium]GMO14577.1 MAG: division/cell wall cluster transcriptional repressor MraZ [Termitinemataceae bacterium]